jgi:hypothetical protein
LHLANLEPKKEIKLTYSFIHELKTYLSSYWVYQIENSAFAQLDNANGDSTKFPIEEFFSLHIKSNAPVKSILAAENL